MFEPTPISSLAQDIASAVFRVSRLVRNAKLKRELESTAVDLVRDLSETSVEVLNRLISLSEVIGEMNGINAEVLRRELGNLSDKIAVGAAGLDEQPEPIYLGDFFGQKADKDNAETTFSKSEEPVDKPKRPKSKSKRGAGADERQAEVAEFIRKFPSDCRMKDLSAQFSEVSERTLRNDIQSLIEKGLVERLGGKSGPSSYFVVVDRGEHSGEILPEKILLPETTQF